MRATMMRTKSGLLLLAAAVSVVMAGAALATPPSGILSGTIFARGSFADPVDIKLKVDGEQQEVIAARDARDTVMQQIVIGPGGHTGWHSHPGPVVVLVKAGELTVYEPHLGQCTSRTYVAGQAFVDSGLHSGHIARNPDLTGNTELWVTYFDVPPGQPVRVDEADPGTCSN